MKRLITAIFAGIAVCSFALAQDQNPPTPPTTPQAQQIPAQQTAAQNTTSNLRARIAPGSVIPVELTKSIDAKKVKNGDPVEAKVTTDLKSNSGDIILAKDAKVTGHITEAQARDKQQKESQVAIAFDHAASKSGGEIMVPMIA